MTLRPVDRWEWLDLIRRARLGRTTKLVAVMLALYANEDGSRVFPGIARLSVVCELGYNTVKDHLALLRAEGWIERVQRTGARGRADEYRLTVRDGSPVPSPAQIEAEIERIRSVKGRRRAQKTEPQPAARAEVPVDNSGPQPTARAEVVDSGTRPQPAPRAEVAPDSEPTSARPTGRGAPTSARLTGTPQPAPRAATNHVPRPLRAPDHTEADPRTAVTGTRAHEAATNPSDEVDDTTRTDPPLRIVADDPTPSPNATTTTGPPVGTLRGFGFCLPCHATGKTVLAADPVTGAQCSYHLREAS